MKLRPILSPDAMTLPWSPFGRPSPSQLRRWFLASGLANPAGSVSSSVQWASIWFLATGRADPAGVVQSAISGAW